VESSYMKVLIAIVVTVISITLGILWKMPFQNAKMINTNTIQIAKDVAKADAHWEEVCRRLERIELKLDQINHE